MTELLNERQCQMAVTEADLKRRSHNFYVGWALALMGVPEADCKRKYLADWDNGMSSGYRANVNSAKQ